MSAKGFVAHPPGFGNLGLRFDKEAHRGQEGNVFFFLRCDISGQMITTSADVTLNGGLIRELPQNPLNSGLGIILICPDVCVFDSLVIRLFVGSLTISFKNYSELLTFFFVLL